jgi:RND superfamily putative drug exporter
MSLHLYKLGRWCYRHRLIVLAVWLTAVVALAAGAKLSGGKTNDAFTMPGTESQQVITVLQRKIPAAAGLTTQVVFANSHGPITSASSAAAMQQALARLRKLPQVASVASPAATGLISPDKHVALATIYYDTATYGDVGQSTIDKLRPAVQPAARAGLQVEFGGSVYPNSGLLSSTPDVIGIVVALVILALTFGSLLVSGVPIVTALVGVAVSSLALTALAAILNVASTAMTVAAMLGLACGIDYSLFVLTRYRQHLLAGDEPEQAAGYAAGTAGDAVVFAALTVIIALCGLSLVGLPFLTTLGLGAAGAVLMALLAAQTLLPAIFGLIGSRAARFSELRIFGRARRATCQAVDAPERTAGARWAGLISRHHGLALVAGIVALAVLATPIIAMRQGVSGAGSRPGTDTSRRAYDLIARHFGVGYNGVLTVVAEPVPGTAAAVRITQSLGRLDHVAHAQLSTLANGVAVVNVVPRQGPASVSTEHLVQYIRAHRRALAAGSGARLLVGGTAAINIDTSAKLAAALPEFLAVVVGLSFILLSFAFRTFVVPLKSILGFLLSMGAALGAQVAVFQWGWLDSLLGVVKGPTLSYLPILLVAIVFGLSSDYEMFVVSRIKENYTKLGDARQSVLLGTGQSARVVTAAALIMICIFGAFTFAPNPWIKPIGFSFALGVALDAFVVRLTLVPAALSILGRYAWLRPRWFARIPDPDIEGERLERDLQRGRGRRPATPPAATAVPEEV